MSGIDIDGSRLNLQQLAQVARSGRQVTLAPHALEAMRRSEAWVQSAAAGEILNTQGHPRAIYGINTGFGSLARLKIPQESLTVLQRNLIRSHAAGVGDPAPRDVSRAMVLLRANALAKGASGCRPELVERLLALLNAGCDPIVPSQGSCGSSGDLAPLAHLGLLLCHLESDPDSETGEAWFGEERLSGREALQRAGISTLPLGPKEGLALTNGAQLSTAFAALALFDAQQLIQLSEIAAAMSIEALRGVTRAFHPSVHALRPYPGAQACSANLLLLMAGSELTDTVSGKVQDAYSLRCTPQIVGSARDALTHIQAQLLVELNAATDNPVICMDVDDEIKAYSAGLFHGEHVGMVSDYLKIASSEVANLSERRLYRLLTAPLSADLPVSLAHSGPGLGLMGLQTTAAALVSENKSLGWPSSVDSIPTCEDQEDHVAMSTTAARRASEVVRNSLLVVQIELLAASRALQWRLKTEGPIALGCGTRAALNILETLPEHLTAPSDALEHLPPLIPAILDAVAERCPDLQNVGGSP
ncbi:MAG: aromatic amino acid ammonia-lyase [Myxococcota bacterium]|nr:aromatic amino acid ammonia-lyase [Myxococcota bacterium]